MNVIYHDLGPEYDTKIQTIYAASDDTIIISEHTPIHACLGCFGCWIKTPGQCVIKDDYQQMGALFASMDSLKIISKNCYGMFSPFIKNLMDRTISYSHPYFTMRFGEMHHKLRYTNKVTLDLLIYGPVTENEKATMGDLFAANVKNFNGKAGAITFLKDKEEVLHETCIH